jgi:hypothetical protein
MSTPKIAVAPAPPKHRTPLSAVKAEAREAPWTVLVHGEPGLGKTTFASKFPDPIFVCAESFGTDELVVARWPDPITCWNDVLDVPRRLTLEEHGHKTLVIDKIDDLEPFVFAEVIGREGKNAANIEEVGGGWNKGVKAAIDYWRIFLAELERMVSARRMNVVLVSHSTRRTRKDPQTENYDRWEPNISQPSAGLLVGWCKEVLFAQEEAVAVKLDGKLAKAKGVSTGVRVLRTKYNAAYDAKNRHSLPDPLPLDYGAFAEAMKTKSVATPAEIRRSIAAKLEQLSDAEVTAKVQKLVDQAADNAQELTIIDNRMSATIESRAKGA